MITRDQASLLDDGDPLSHARKRFVVPDGIVYLDGNSLGLMPRGVPARSEQILEQWSLRLIRGWMEEGWWELPLRLGDRIGGLVGARPGSVVVCDTTTTNLYKALLAAAALRPGRTDIVIEEGAFPTDRYVAESVAGRIGGRTRVMPRGGPSVDTFVDEEVAAVVMNHVDFRTAEIAHMSSVTEALHPSGALVIWDLSHSAGVLPISLDLWDVDFAVGCTYKYLNGGPGAPAYLYVNAMHLEGSTNPIPGWIGHADPFLMEAEYRPAGGVRRFITGTQPIVSMAVLDAALDAYDGVAMTAVREKTIALTELFIDLVDERLGLEVASPRDPRERGSQVSLRHPDAAGMYERLVAAGLQGDHRPPDLLRFGFAPLYVSYADVWDAVDILSSVLGNG
ncbi:MAG TPA: kynureninase [Acidimicrobiia bacterium]|nr:kynureninase [Acidimicrobiia bacterium]